jgi:DNA-binding MarR family transcriptional regulator
MVFRRSRPRAERAIGDARSSPRSGGRSPRRLALEMDAGGVAHTLKPLAHVGLIAIDVDPKERLNRLIRLTRSGQAKLKESDNLWEAAQRSRPDWRRSGREELHSKPRFRKCHLRIAACACRNRRQQRNPGTDRQELPLDSHAFAKLGLRSASTSSCRCRFRPFAGGRSPPIPVARLRVLEATPERPRAARPARQLGRAKSRPSGESRDTPC